MAAAVDAAADDLCRVQAEPLSHDECVRFVTRDDCGAVATFLGVTRDNFAGKKVVTLRYEAYAPMAEAKMREICAAAREAFGVKRGAALHRTGEVAVGEASVILAFASPHRADALKAVAWAIDELKAKVPVWKQEVYADGAPAWKENAEFDPAKLSEPVGVPDDGAAG
mmetsp:Transcript_2118/g.6282  ORF Transcript_2118/g.6282 Transcript_2118/m.6282 type:complete len:168 (+) Transcript_2118:257-760(+)